MNRLFVAIGNPLRGDDGVAWRVLDRLRLSGDRLHLHQLTPEVAAEIAPYAEVVFLDADVEAEVPVVEPVGDATAASAFTHHVSPAAVVRAARLWFGFAGNAWLCRLPARDFEPVVPSSEVQLLR
ncbi:MAG: hypothetical protein JNK87_16270 [Bryobacterales bacterium]|nr:hypothetical protein [Bryobacterales bacterium]